MRCSILKINSFGTTTQNVVRARNSYQMAKKTKGLRLDAEELNNIIV
jgi:hypothetical protein